MDLNDKEESGAGTKIFGENEPSLKYGSKKQVVKGGILGFFIGLAVIVPGVSGSAVAVIFGLYEKLLYAFGNFLRRREPRHTGCVYLPYAFLIPPRASRIFSHSGLKMLVFSTRTGMSFLISSEFASITDLAFL